MKKMLLALVALFMLLPAMADEGMWLPSLIKSRVKDMRANGFKLSAEDIYSVNKASLKDAVVLFGGFCTGEIVSEKGLVITNHHCGFDAIQSHSTVEHDYLTHGFWAMSSEEELPNPGLWVRILVRMEDVTERLAAGETADDIIRKAQAEGRNYHASIEQMYYGNQQFLFLYQQFNDVRLVGTPPSSIGKFGGDTDNWIWPRHTGDFSVFRIYADKENQPAAYSPENVPYRPKRHFKISTDGIEEGDFTMIYGFPGNTQQYITSTAVRYVQYDSDPMKIDLRTRRLDIIRAASEADAKIRIQYASKYANIANAWKKWQGEVLGLERLNTVAAKEAYEADFRRWSADKPEYASLLDSMQTAYEQTADWYWLEELKNESVRTIELSIIAADVAREVNPATAPSVRNAMRHSGYRDLFFKDYDVNVDKALTLAVLKGYREYLKKYCRVDEELEKLISESGSLEQFVDNLYAQSLFTSAEKCAKVNFEQVQQDPAYKLYMLFRSTTGRLPRNLSNVPAIEQWYRPYLKALMQFDPERPFFPDANMTLRVAYGTICGYEYADGEYHTPLTTLDGIIAKDNPAIYDYDIPQALRDIYRTKEYGRWGVEINGHLTVPVCFLASNQTTGGNSGSPVLNGKGELIGVNFDRTWRSTMSDIAFDPTICRNIACDIRYVLFVIDKVGGAGYLIEEMGL
ncbi:MAG: S46 family peptidase [Rikenellaceae bacterium]|nr:S46 family peptidase [Rikenellaceae bacterium]